MNWINGLSEAINYIEDNLDQELKMENIAENVFISSFYFQKTFALLCGFTVGEYIRQRRLTCAGADIVATNEKIIDIAIKYGYDSPDSFTKAFTRFHGSTPSAVRKNGALIKAFAPLKLKFSLEGGYIMDYKIVKKEAFRVLGVAKNFRYETATEEIPKFWKSHYEAGKGEVVCGMYGINMDKDLGMEQFQYLIADDYDGSKTVPEGFEVVTIPQHTWAIFPSEGKMPDALQEVNKKIFSEWLPNSNEYEIAEGYCIEYYTDISKYEMGNQDANYYCEMWIPVKKK